MTERKRFKFQSSAKIAKSIRLGVYEDVVVFAARDDPGRTGCFRITLTNLIRVKDLLKFQNDLRELQRLHASDDPTTADTDREAPSFQQRALEILVDCAKRASPSELDYICRLTAAFYRDVRIPLDAMLEIVEDNPHLKSKAIFTLMLTCFKVQTAHILRNIHAVLRDMLPWLNHRNALVRRLAMEALGTLLRRLPLATVREVVSAVIATDGAEKIVFAIIQNVDGNFTSKVEALFTFLLDELVPARAEDRARVADNIRSTIRAMGTHAKEGNLELGWLKRAYEARVRDLAAGRGDLSATLVALELSLEMMATFGELKFTPVKKLPLARSAEDLGRTLEDLVIPMLRFLAAGGHEAMFEDLASYLLRTARSGGEAEAALGAQFGRILDHVNPSMVKAGNLNSFLSLFEWRLKCDDPAQVAHIMLVVSRILSERDVFHPLLVNPGLVNRVLASVEAALDAPDSESFETLVNVFGMLSGLARINALSVKFRAGGVAGRDALFRRVLAHALRGMERGHDARVTVRLYATALALLEGDRAEWVTALAAAAPKLGLLDNHLTLEFLADNFTPQADALLDQVLQRLPSESSAYRLNAIRLAQRRYRDNAEIGEWLKLLAELEALPNDVESARTKCVLMEKAVGTADLDALCRADGGAPAEMLKKILLSQYFVKFSPLWEGAFSALTALIAKLKTREKALGATWALCIGLLSDHAPAPKFAPLSEPVEAALDFRTDERTDAVTLQAQLLRVTVEVVATARDRERKIADMVEYTMRQFADSSEFLRNAVCTLSGLLTKYKATYSDELFETCATTGLRAGDPKVREASLMIVAARHAVDTKRLATMCTGTSQQIAALTSANPYADLEPGEDARTRDLAIGIEVRLLSHRIHQNATVPHGNALVDYFLHFDAKYAGLLLMELVPNELAGLFKPRDAELEWVVATLRFGACAHAHRMPSVLATVSLLVRRLAHHLRPHATAVAELCCRVLERATAGQEPNAVAERSFKVLAELAGVFGAGYLVDTLARHAEAIVALTKAGMLDFALACTAQLEHTDAFCARAVPALFPAIFAQDLTKSHLALAANIYGLYPRHAKASNHDVSPAMSELMVRSAETLLDSMERCQRRDCDTLSCLVELELDPQVKRKALAILLAALPERAAMTKALARNDKDELELWKKILGALEQCTDLLEGDRAGATRLWDFVDCVMALVPDVRCRKLAAALLEKIPEGSGVPGAAHTGARLLAMNGVTVDLKLDADRNVEAIAELVEELDAAQLGLRSINSLLTHAMFLLMIHQRDPGVRRAVATLTAKVLETVRTTLEAGAGTDDATALLANTLFPALRRCLGGNSEDALVCLCLEVLEQFIATFRGAPGARATFSALHGDLLSPEVAEALRTLRQLQKYKRLRGMRQLQRIVEARALSTSTMLKLVIPLGLQFMIQKNAVRHTALADAAKQCLIACCKTLPAPSLVKMLKKLLQIYRGCKYPIVLTVFAEAARAGVALLPPAPEEGTPFKDTLGVGTILARLRKMSLVAGKRNLGDVPVVEVFECMGQLLRYYPDHIVARELVKQTRILAKLLASRNRDVRRMARISLIKLAKPFGTRYVDVFVRELATHMTKGYKLSVLIFTVYAILNKVLDSENILGAHNELKPLYAMILNEVTRSQERDESRSMVDEARHPKSSQLITLISEHASQEVVETNFTFLFALLNGKLEAAETHALEYSDKLLRRTNELIVSATSGLILNRNVDALAICLRIFVTMLPRVRGMARVTDQFPPELARLFRALASTGALRDAMQIEAPKEPREAAEETPAGRHLAKLRERYTVMPGAATGRSFAAALKKPGFDEHIFAPLFVNACLRLLNHLVAGGHVTPGPSGAWAAALDAPGGPAALPAFPRDAAYSLCEFCTLASFLSEEVLLQKSSCSCLLRICRARPALIEDFGLVLATSLVDRMGALDLVGSEDLAKDHIALISLFFRDEHLDTLHEAWARSGRSGKLIDSLLIQIETNLNRPKLHTALLRLLIVLMQATVRTNMYTVTSGSMRTAAAKPGPHSLVNGVDHTAAANDKENKVFFEKEFYTVSYEVMIRMLKGNVATRAVAAVAKVVGFAFVLLPMDEKTRSKRFALILKHANAPDPQVRLLAVRTMLVIARELPGQLLWKRYASLVTLAALPQLVAEDDPACRRFLQQLVTHIWASGTTENKNELLDVVAHFAQKMKHAQLAVSFFAFLALRDEPLRGINRLKLGVLDAFVAGIGPHWQHCYYWLRLLEHLVAVQCDLTRQPASQLWEFARTAGLGSQHPWVLASSLRTLALVLRSPRLGQLIPDFAAAAFTLLKTALRHLSTYSGAVERHKKLELATQDALTAAVDVLARARDRALERLASRLCYSLRCALGRKGECPQRIAVTLEVLGHIAAKDAAYEPRRRVMLLKLIIAVFRVAHFKQAAVSARWQSRLEDSAQADRAAAILEAVEQRFNALDAAAEYLKLLSFARNFVLKARLAKKKQLALALVTNTRMAALRKQRRNRQKRKKFRR